MAALPPVSRPPLLLQHVIEGRDSKGRFCKFTVRDTFRGENVKDTCTFAGVLEYPDKARCVCVLKEDDKTKKEARAFARISGVPNIVNAFEEIGTRDRSFIAQEKLSKNLFELIMVNGPFSLRKTQSIGRDLLKAMHALGQKDLIFGDIKLENVAFAEDGTAKLFDVEGLTHVSEKRDMPHMFNFHSIPPEGLFGMGIGCSYDMWCLGALLYSCISDCSFLGYKGDIPSHTAQQSDLVYQYCTLLGNPPTLYGSGLRFDGFIALSPKSPSEIVLKNKPSRNFLPLTWKQLQSYVYRDAQTAEDCRKAAQFMDFLRRVFTYNYSTRLTPEQALKHPFFAEDSLKPCDATFSASKAPAKKEQKETKVR